MLKEVYVSPSVQLVLLRADSKLASNNEIDFDDFFGDVVLNPENGDSAVDVDIDLG